jgi:hypothetical protein
VSIVMHQRPVESTRTAGSNCAYEVEAIVDGTPFTARSRRGAPFALARVLVEAGIPDHPVSVTHEGLRGDIRYASLNWMAKQTIKENATQSVTLVRYVEAPDFGAGKAAGAHERVDPIPGVPPTAFALWRGSAACF